MSSAECCDAVATKRARCPACGARGVEVQPATIESLVAPEARSQLSRVDGFRFCSKGSCDVAYFHPESGEQIAKDKVAVRIGLKETEAPRPVCYCFGHTVEDIEAQVEATGRSAIPVEIAAKCSQGLGRCEVTNPQGSCCLGNVRGAVKDAQVKFGKAEPAQEAAGEPCCSHEEEEQAAQAPQPAASRSPRAGTWATVGAIVAAVLSSACCWLPLVLIAFGISGGALSAKFEAWRPVLLPATFLLLGVAFYLTYRRPRTVAVAAESDEGRCATPALESSAEACCPPEGARGFTIKKANKVMLWGVTVFVIAFAFFPNYVGALLGGGNTLAGRDNLDKMVVKIDGMTCEACTVSVAKAIRAIPGVAGAEVRLKPGVAVVGIRKGMEVPRAAIVKAISSAGYKARFPDGE